MKREDKNYQEGKYVEAVFAGHTHMTGGFRYINTSNMNIEKFNLDTGNIPFSWPTVYVETDTACKEYP